MFHSRIVFILGAGSSHEVGLPLGSSLKTRIAEKINFQYDFDRLLNGDADIARALFEHTKKVDNWPDPNPYLLRAQQLSIALPLATSIDSLLDAHKNIDKHAEICGKLGIAKCILEAESKSEIFLDPFESTPVDFFKNDHWFKKFIQMLVEEVDKKDLDTIFSHVSFINFNYDRCLEHYLVNALQAYFNANQHEVTKSISKLKIYHPYGGVGPLPWQANNLTSIPFGAPKADLLNISKNIKTFSERIHENDITSLRETIQTAEVIVFLGFAFHRQNLELLASENEFKAKRVYATAIGISDSDKEVLKNDLKHLLKQTDQKADIIIRNDLKCAELFQHYWRSLTTR